MSPDVDDHPGSGPRAPAVGLYLDQRYWRAGERVVAERSFMLFVNHVARRSRRLVVMGRLADPPARGEYALDEEVGFVVLPGYPSGDRAGAVLRSIPRSVARLWRELPGIDVLWLLGPSALSVVFALVAALRRTPVVLGVRQDLRSYVRTRHPRRRAVHAAADALELTYRALARRRAVVVVGADLAARYRGARALLEITVSLVEERELATEPGAARPQRDAAPQLSVLAVTRLDAEKNPLLLADVLAALRSDGRDWRLVVCGDGPLKDALHARLRQLGVDKHAQLRGHVSLQGELRELYRSADMLLHVSWTEGVPQVLFEAFAAGLPVVATDVGGVAAAAGTAALLVRPGDAAAAAAALRRVVDERETRARLTDEGLRQVAAHTAEREADAVAGFLARAARRDGGPAGG